ncbi:hypothetical protein MNBD_GAMMA09-1173 [hydrothermal vent metagenome]|uniref:Arrestin C-terminal-like domain-containing protein n=1 Tax=hydrothermal vent metagenome TaxID=652676 RepID=A0A3B0YQQ0_9ZZZZ
MSKCNVWIEVGDVNYQPGDTVTGTAYVEVDKECKCDALTIKKYWATHGKGNCDSGAAESLELFTGLWQPGTYNYPFEFVFERTPVSYHGYNINIDWYLDLRADIPWSMDPRGKQDLILEKCNDDRYSADEVAGEAHSSTELTTQKFSPYILILFPLIFMLIGLYMLIVNFDIIFGGVFTFAGAAISYKFIQSTLAERKLGQVKCELDINTVKPGDEIKCSITFSPKSKIKVNAITASLIGKEISTSGSGTNRSTYYHTFHLNKKKMSPSGHFEKSDYVTDNVLFDIPSDAVASFSARNNDIVWSVEVDIDINKWPDWNKTLAVVVID